MNLKMAKWKEADGKERILVIDVEGKGVYFKGYAKDFKKPKPSAQDIVEES